MILKNKMTGVTDQTYPTVKRILGYVWRVRQMIGTIYMSTKAVILVCGNLQISQP